MASKVAGVSSEWTSQLAKQRLVACATSRLVEAYGFSTAVQDDLVSGIDGHSVHGLHSVVGE